MRKLVSLTAMLLLFSAVVFAQTRTIIGKVLDETDGSPLSGVTVAGGTTAVQTDNEGRYRIDVPSSVTLLVFTYIGFESKEVLIGAESEITVTLQNSQSSLQEVVVVGYGTQKRKDLTGSVATVKGELLSTVAVPSVDKYLAGQVTGVHASTPSGILGQAARIRIRGTNSISNTSEPLYVIDGVPYISNNQGTATPYNPLSDINPNDIETLDVLKDGAATAIYGSRAANGVILITTKRGKQGRARVSYDSWFAWANASKRFDLLNADEFVTIANEKIKNTDPNEVDYAHRDPSGVDTDWQDLVLRRAFQHSHNLSVSGATDQTNYFLSLGYTDMDGITVSNSLNKYNLRAKIEQKALNNYLTVGANIAATHNTNNGLNTGTNALSGNIGNAIRAFPNVVARHADGTYNLSEDNQRLGRGVNGLQIDDNYTNIIYVLDHNVFKSQALNLSGNAFARVKIIDGLNIGTQIGINYLSVEDFWYYNPKHGDGRGSGGIVDQRSNPLFRYNWQNTIDYTKSFGQHSLNLVAGQEVQKTKERWFGGSGTGLSNVFFGENGNIISNTLANQFYDGGYTQKAFLSYFARANYSFQDKYLLSATLRNDKISSLPWGRQGATLPGVSVGWRISKENFMNTVTFIDDMKIRGGYAEVGNVEIGNFPYAGTFGPVLYGASSGVQYDRMGNPLLRFETSKKINVGIDLSMFANRLTFTGDYFKNDIDNLILDAPTAPSLGVPKNIFATNIGNMTNQGAEFAISTTNIQKPNFSWNSTLNFTFVKNQVLKLSNNNADIINSYNVTRVGNSIGEFFGYEYAGVNPANGNPLWYKTDVDSKTDYLVQADWDTYKYYRYDPANPTDTANKVVGALTFSDKRILGIGNPTWFGGFNNTFTYRGLDLSIFLTFSGGNKVYNITRQESLNNLKFMNGGKELLDRWTTAGQETSVPKLYYGEDNFVNQNGNLNSRFLERGDFLRAQNISFGYTIPKNVLSTIMISSARVYAQVQNAFIITKYKGLDPELSNSVTTNNTPGLDYNTNPLPRTFTLGLNVSF